MNVPGDKQAFVERFGAVFEHSPWVAERAWARRPFPSIDALHAAMVQAVSQAERHERLALVRAHPELAGSTDLTPHSSAEQKRLGFTSLTRLELQQMSSLNRRYREKFGFPCIVALKLHATRASVVAEMQRRCANGLEAELAAALEQVGHIARGRLEKLLEER